MSDEFDWVAARDKCSTVHVFHELRMGVEEDVRAMNRTLAVAKYDKSSVAVRANTMGDYFVVFRADNSNTRAEFNCQIDRIELSKGGKQFTATLTLNKEGKCRFRIDGGEEMEEWQVRHFMLEELFFGK